MKTLILFLLSFLFISCDKLCNQTIHDSVDVNNQTGNELNLLVCKNFIDGLAQLNIKLNQNESMDAGTHLQPYVAGGTAQCNRGDAVLNTKIYLTTDNFDQVKFCHHTDTTIIETLIIDNASTCPSDYTEQTEAIEKCENN